MPLKRHKDKPWEWVDTKCFEKQFLPQPNDLADCDGVMVLKDVVLKGGDFKTGSEEGQVYHIHKDPCLEKIWVCDTCGFVFPE
jgi:hypothetical protein